MDIIDSIIRSKSVDSNIASLSDNISLISKTNGISPIGLIGRGGNREIPGFTPNESYDFGVLPNRYQSSSYADNVWFGVLLDSHPDYTGPIKDTFKSTSDLRFNKSIDYPNSTNHYSKRDYFLLFNDTSTDYFAHGLQVINGLSPLRSAKNNRETWDGSEEGIPGRLSQFQNTPYENTDPVIFGFELIIDAVSSPLLNGSVEDFIAQFNRISEVASRSLVIADFKQQFAKIFKTKGTIKSDPIPSDRKTISIPTSNYANIESSSNVYNPGKPAYLSYYLKKIQGLDLLIESNSTEKKKYIPDYRKEMLKLSFSEDISLSIGTLAHLYKLLYWSKPNAKNVIPENLLRFNCDIVISEVRNINRVRKAINNRDLEVIKENVSRHIYSLKECQFWFDQSAHEGELDLSNMQNMGFDNFTVGMDFKYVTSKFERWVPDDQRFGIYVGYDNGAIWKIGNPGARTAASQSGIISDTSIPKFYTSGLNLLNANGVIPPVIPFKSYNYTMPGGSGEVIIQPPISEIDIIKNNSNSSVQNLAKDFKKAIFKEVQQQVNIRVKLLNDTIDKIRNAAYIGRMREPTNIYKIPYYYQDLSNALGGQVSSNFFYDVHNALRDFAGDSIGSALGGDIIKGGNKPLFPPSSIL